MEEILKDPGFQDTLQNYAREKGLGFDQVEQEARTYLKELYTVQHPIIELLATQGAQFVLSRGYEKTIDVNPVEIKKLTKLMRRNAIAFVMTHKTYIDMLVLALVLKRHGLPLPYIFSGINMSFLGLGQLGRKTGAIFIRRSFKENQIYKYTLRHFIATLINEKSHFMWAIEGTRSRTGKLVWPKMGILKYIREGESHSHQPVKYVPVSIVYDLIPDVKLMTEEGRGKEKKAESLGWFVKYLQSLREKMGRISLRFGEPVELGANAYSATLDQSIYEASSGTTLSKLAFELVHQINRITPVTTASLVCISLLSKFALNKQAIESDIADLMELIESHKPDALVDRGRPIGESVRIALNLLTQARLIQQKGESLHAKYTIVNENYLPATYYANMAVQHFYHRAFIELALLKLVENKSKDRLLDFWTEIMALRDLFKFEFFYSTKDQFSDEIEADLRFMDPEWEAHLADPKFDLLEILKNQSVFVSPVVLFTYIEAYRVVGHGLLAWDEEDAFDESRLLENCQLLGEEMHWHSQIRRIEAVSKPFLVNGVRLARNRKLIPDSNGPKEAALKSFIQQLESLSNAVLQLQELTLQKTQKETPLVPVERAIVPGSKTDSITREIIEGESGPHIAAFFDLDRTLIKGFSAREFFQTRLLSGKITTRELIAQFAGVLVYAIGNGNFAGLAAIGAQGVKGIKEQVFIDVGEEVYLKYLAEEIYPESRALVSAHMAKGHTVAIVSAATPYQVNPIARDLGIEHIMCTRMEVQNGTFTGNIEEPACWGDGKAYHGREFGKEHNIDLSKSYFYTDSAEDMPLLEIVGHPRPMNPDTNLSAIAFKNDWHIYRFNDESRAGIMNILRTGLAVGSMVPAVMIGLLSGASSLSWRDGVNSMMASVGDLVTSMAGIKLVVKGKEHLWSQRPAVFIFNHQSSADMFITAKLVRKNARGVAKKELKSTPILGLLMQAAGIIFVDRGNREKAIEALAPAVEEMKNGISIIIAPEGTRSYDYRLGRFKKGAFHLAMQAGVPIVPIIIKNAHDVMPRGSNLFKPSAVEVVIKEPVSTQDWTVENLNSHIDMVRNLYLEELGQLEEQSSQ